jgi:tRNA1(Val) A37 N6-methylase TrmN6
LARAGQTPLANWVTLAAKRLKPRGYATFIQRIERLPELLSAALPYLGSLEVLPLAPRQGRPARLVLMRGRKDGRAPFVLHTPKVIHAKDQHREPGTDYTAAFTAVMQGHALTFGPESATNCVI